MLRSICLITRYKSCPDEFIRVHLRQTQLAIGKRIVEVFHHVLNHCLARAYGINLRGKSRTDIDHAIDQLRSLAK
jgi:hypothetical protein